MFRRGVALVLLGFATLTVVQPSPASAHAGLQHADPAEGASLGATPTAVQLAFSEEPEPSLSSIQVVDGNGTSYTIGRAGPVTSDPRALAVRVRPLARGVYTVSWRAVSAVDGHASAGAYAFGVRVKPTAADTAAAALTTTPSPSVVEVVGRWLLIAGLALLLGVAAAGAAGYGAGAGGGVLGAAAWGMSAAGLVLLADAQRRNAATSFGDLLETAVGRALVWRAVAIAAVGVALLVARSGSRRTGRVAVAAAAVAAVAAMGVHVAAGHAGGGGSKDWASIATQWAHFAAVGVWLGGLAALLFSVRGATSATATTAVRRFSLVAIVGLVVVLATGLVRAFGELSWGELFSTGYGRAVVAKTLLIVGIAVFAGFNRWRAVPAASTMLRPLRRNSSAEFVLAAGALAVAALLGTLTPPGDASTATRPGLSVAGADFATTVRARLTAASAEAGPNRFSVRVVDYDSGRPVRASGVGLRFRPLDDPGVAASTLALHDTPDRSWVGSGANLSFDGRWRVTVLVERGSASATVPLELNVPTAPQFVSVTRVPDEPPFYAVQIADETDVLFAIDPERAGPNKITVTFADVISDERAVASVVLTTQSGSRRAVVHPTKRLSRGRFVAEADLDAGNTRVAATARTPDGTRLRAAFVLTVGGDG